MVDVTATQTLQRTGLAPLVRATHSQVEIDYLPPYGDPEVNLVGEIATYLVVSTVVVELVDRLTD